MILRSRTLRIMREQKIGDAPDSNQTGARPGPHAACRTGWALKGRPMIGAALPRAIRVCSEIMVNNQ